ncbi:MAG TPA: MBOAT family O-acyltransferase, partial [Steroidobacteraceae bacterium]
DMAVGLSLLIGVRLPYNFNSPYQAWNITEFWRRWHMTLSRFLRDYLYVPLGGNRHGRARRYVNLMLTMLLGGLWHGASWTFVIWGGLHGAYLVVNHGWQWLREKLGWKHAASGLAAILGRSASVALTLLCVMIGWVFFRAVDVASATGILASMFGLRDGGLPITALAGYSHGIVPWIALFSLLALFGRNSQALIDGHLTAWLDRRAERPRHPEWLAGMAGAMCVGVVFMAIAAASRTVTEFIYFNF